MVSEKGDKGGDPYVQRRGMNTWNERRVSETGKRRLHKRTKHDCPGSSAQRRAVRVQFVPTMGLVGIKPSARLGSLGSHVFLILLCSDPMM